MTVGAILLAVGLLAIFLEFFLPGAILGTIGALLLIASIIVVAIDTESVTLTLLFFIIAFIAVVLVVKVAFWRIKNSKDSFYLNTDQEGYVASTWNVAFIGREVVVESDLKPGGYITVDGNQYLAISQSGYINKGEHVVIIGGEGDSFRVIPKYEKSK